MFVVVDGPGILPPTAGDGEGNFCLSMECAAVNNCTQWSDSWVETYVHLQLYLTQRLFFPSFRWSNKGDHELTMACCMTVGGGGL